MSTKPSMPGLPPGMPDPEAIFQSWWPIIIALVGGLFYGIRQYFRGARCTSELKLEDKVAIVTGGNGGIGRYIVEDFAKRGARVYIACVSDGEAVVKEVKEKTKNEKIFAIKCDLSSLKSVQSFVDAFKKKEDKLHYLINNAGVMMAPKSITDDKFEYHLQVNYLGHFFLTHLLYDTLKQSAPSRIMNTTAPAYQLAELDFEDINFETKEYVPSAAYAQSKLAVVFFTKEFAKRFPVEDVGVTMNCIIPGVVRTKIHRHMPFRQSAFINLTFAPFMWYMMKHPEDGAQTTVFCTLADALSKVSGFLYK
ncbi:retinol dehydrogenase 13-like [Ruditapes philippinarum]|uniref:retinol dehydrogenase 13-like n=1 Tax=Ruditapes philippinarum TaxID=129788 RepID=UPI00295B239F|nr:retinol dehydrogenase 13-like [Ruditapes philippinarum]